LVRDPRDFVTSGMNREYYLQNSVQYQRLSYQSDWWKNLNQLQKITNEWNVTNRFIERFKEDLPRERVVTFRCEDIFGNLRFTKELLDFISPNLHISDKCIELNLQEKINKNLSEKFPLFSEWTESEISSFGKVINKDLMKSYNY